MLKHIKVLLKDNFIFIAIILTIVILCLSLIKTPSTVKIDVKNVDKVFHALAYFTLTISWLFSFYKKPNKKYAIVISCIIFGIIIEALQNILTNYRTADYLDIFANSLGALFALVFFNIFQKNRIN
ncbi:VanZ family protein [Polaribacter porphyrae]|uniref:VanZ-like domain-containing protein n=1 Tax=Polaribacter porphyrae TaxID=1137780 RepID=A0A2S7WQ90_9FLAO|nr:VanZ family protein [Polaribacter porphyrae]PQJ79482.1 hypothetical protein BTO18_09995 [Polaribacter porphyrae]